MKKFNTRSTHPRQLSLISALALALLLAACSTVRFTYNHGDTLLYWWLNAYIDVESEQADWVKQDIGHFFSWHRQTQLRDYASLLGTAQRQLAGNVTQKDLLDDFQQIKSRSQLMLEKSAPELADLALAMTPEQIANLEKKFDKNNKEYQRKFMAGDFDKRKRVRYEKAMDQLKLWFGHFSREQEAQIRALSDARPLDNEIWLDERLRRQRKILDLVRRVQAQKPGKEAVTAQIVGLIRETFARFDQSERKAFFDGYLDTTSKFIVSVIRLTTPEQKAHAQKRMAGWIEDLNALAAGK